MASQKCSKINIFVEYRYFIIRWGQNIGLMKIDKFFDWYIFEHHMKKCKKRYPFDSTKIIGTCRFAGVSVSPWPGLWSVIITIIYTIKYLYMILTNIQNISNIDRETAHHLMLQSSRLCQASRYSKPLSTVSTNPL